jgi:hypothetical protein
MLSLVVAVIGLALFFCLTLYFCVRDVKQDADARPDWANEGPDLLTAMIEMKRKSPLGRWRY